MSLVGRTVVQVPRIRRIMKVRAIMALDELCIHRLAPKHHRQHRYPIEWWYQGAQCRHFSEIPGGANLLTEEEGNENEEGRQLRPKITLDAHAPTGFDVSNMIQKVKEEENNSNESGGGTVHMTGSIFAFPRACFLWKNVTSAENVTLETLAPVIIHRPKIKYLFLGCNEPIPSQELNRIKTELKKKAGIVAEQVSLHNAMGTFNILNGEDRSVAAALILDKNDAQE